MKLWALSCGVALLATAACDSNPGKDKTKATVAEAVSAAPAPGTGETYRFSQADSKIEFVGAKVTRKHDGSFGVFAGRIVAPEGKPETASVSVAIDVTSLTVDEARLTAHLKSPDFFDAAKFPQAKFSSTEVRPGGEKGATHTVTGNLELHGVTKSLSFPATIRMGAGQVEAGAEFVISRKDFGIVYPGLPDDLIRDDVALKLTIHAKRAP